MADLQNKLVGVACYLDEVLMFGKDKVDCKRKEGNVLEIFQQHNVKEEEIKLYFFKK